VFQKRSSCSTSNHGLVVTYQTFEQADAFDV